MLWSKIFLKKGKVYVKTLLERAKGSLLDVSIDQDVPIDTITLLSPYTQQIGYLEFRRNYWEGIRKYSQVNPGPLPLLRTLTISSYEPDDGSQPTITTPPQSPLFTNAVNVEEFTFNSRRFQFLNHFIFPNLTTFTLWTGEITRPRASDLFNFLKASPMLRTVRISTNDGIALGDIPWEMVVALPNVETFQLMGETKNIYDVAVHISCPSARNVSFTYQIPDIDMLPGREIFSTSIPWSTIIRQYTRDLPVEEVALEVRPLYDPCSLTFRSSDASTISLGFELIPVSDDMDELDIDYEEADRDIFSQGFQVIRTHPLLPNVKRLHIRRGYPGFYILEMQPFVTEIERTFGHVGSLDELIINGCDLEPYLAAFENLDDSGKLVVFPPIKELTILHPWMEVTEEDCMDAIVGIAKSQHTRGKPFERVTVRANKIPVTMAERLRQWARVADCYVEDMPDVGDWEL